MSFQREGETENRALLIQESGTVQLVTLGDRLAFNNGAQWGYKMDRLSVQ